MTSLTTRSGRSRSSNGPMVHDVGHIFPNVMIAHLKLCEGRRTQTHKELLFTWIVLIRKYNKPHCYYQPTFPCLPHHALISVLSLITHSSYKYQQHNLFPSLHILGTLCQTVFLLFLPATCFPRY